MKREILFRGFNNKHKEWRYGYYFVNRGQHFIVEDKIEKNPILSEEDFAVNPETIGQYTGLKDKNGKEIYEGDIVIIGEKLKAKVIYYDGAFRMQSEFSPTPIDTTDMGYMMREFSVRVIGNIHDNPELIK